MKGVVEPEIGRKVVETTNHKVDIKFTELRYRGGSFWGLGDIRGTIMVDDIFSDMAI